MRPRRRNASRTSQWHRRNALCDGQRHCSCALTRRAGRPASRGAAAVWVGVLVVVSLSAIPASAEIAAGVDLDGPGERFSLLPPGERLVLEDALPAADPAPEPAAPERRPNWLWTSVVAGGAIVGSALNSVFDGNHQSYHFGDEGWFGRDTHFGGADKAAHFVDYYIVSKEFAKLFVLLGHKPENARWLAAGVSALTGLVTEIGDGQNR